MTCQQSKSSNLWKCRILWWSCHGVRRHDWHRALCSHGEGTGKKKRPWGLASLLKEHTFCSCQVMKLLGRVIWAPWRDWTPHKHSYLLCHRWQPLPSGISSNKSCFTEHWQKKEARGLYYYPSPVTCFTWVLHQPWTIWNREERDCGSVWKFGKCLQTPILANNTVNSTKIRKNDGQPGLVRKGSQSQGSYQLYLQKLLWIAFPLSGIFCKMWRRSG